MENILLVTLLVFIVLIIAVLVWLVLEIKKLKHELALVSEQVERNNKDVVGLCSAAVRVDARLTDYAKQLNEITDKIEDIDTQGQDQEPQSQAYHIAIQRVKQGAGVNELVNECSLSREEAALLIRLHGPSR